jgi:Spy/CpxP family protein refolding chaperone
MLKRILAITAFAAITVPAQTPPGQPDFSSIRTYLNLSDTQLQGLQQIQTQSRTANQTVMQEIAAKQQALQTALAATPPNAATIGGLMIEIQALRKKITDSNATLTQQASNILTPDQKTKMAALSAAQQLQDEIHQAVALHLLAIPDRPQGVGAGPGGPGGSGGRMGFGPPQSQGGPRFGPPR